MQDWSLWFVNFCKGGPYCVIVAMGVPNLTYFCKNGPFLTEMLTGAVKSGALSSFHTTQGPPVLKHINHRDQSCNFVFFKSNNYINKIYIYIYICVCINKKKEKID